MAITLRCKNIDLFFIVSSKTFFHYLYGNPVFTASEMKPSSSGERQEISHSEHWTPRNERSWTLLPPDAPHIEIVSLLDKLGWSPCLGKKRFEI